MSSSMSQEMDSTTTTTTVTESLPPTTITITVLSASSVITNTPFDTSTDNGACRLKQGGSLKLCTNSGPTPLPTKSSSSGPTVRNPFAPAVQSTKKLYVQAKSSASNLFLRAPNDNSMVRNGCWNNGTFTPSWIENGTSVYGTPNAHNGTSFSKTCDQCYPLLFLLGPLLFMTIMVLTFAGIVSILGPWNSVNPPMASGFRYLQVVGYTLVGFGFLNFLTIYLEYYVRVQPFIYTCFQNGCILA